MGEVKDRLGFPFLGDEAFGCSMARERARLVLAGTNFYPCPTRGTPTAACAAQLRAIDIIGETHLLNSLDIQTQPRHGFPNIRILIASDLQIALLSYARTIAPSGATSCSKYFHKATNSFRARATIPIRLMRPEPPPNRF